MIQLRLALWLLPGIGMMFAAPALADNPIVQTLYTADPAPVVHEGTVYLYVSHDEDVTVNDFFTMNDWRLYTSQDIVNWRDHGSPLSYRDFAWSSGDAWAPHVVPRNGKWYFYVPITQTNSGRPAIGVAVSDSPEGPFEDPLGHPLVADDWGDIDPSVFIDDDGQAYLYWGNPNLKYVRLNEDMISYSGSVVSVPMTTQSFGSRSGDAERPTLYEEGPWFYRRNDTYYLVYPAGGIPEYIAYSTSSSPTGPFTYQGVIMPTEGASFTNHPGVIDFADRSFFFYHNGALPGGGGFKRSVCVEEFSYNADGTFPTITMTTEGASQVAPLNPYAQVEAETIAWQEGIETEVCGEGGMNVTEVSNGDYIKVAGVDFGTGASSFEVRAASGAQGGNLELRLGSKGGDLLATCAIEGTGGWQQWTTVTCTVAKTEGVHDLFLVFTGGSGNLFNLDWWRFTAIDPTPSPDVTGETDDTATGVNVDAGSDDSDDGADDSSGDGASPDDSTAGEGSGGSGANGDTGGDVSDGTSSAGGTGTNTSGSGTGAPSVGPMTPGGANGGETTGGSNAGTPPSGPVTPVPSESDVTTPPHGSADPTSSAPEGETRASKSGGCSVNGAPGSGASLFAMLVFAAFALCRRAPRPARSGTSTHWLALTPTRRRRRAG